MSSQWHGGKGSARRPTIVDRAKYEENYHRIFGYKNEKKCEECGEYVPNHTNRCILAKENQNVMTKNNDD